MARKNRTEPEDNNILGDLAEGLLAGVEFILDRFIQQQSVGQSQDQEEEDDPNIVEGEWREIPNGDENPIGETEKRQPPAGNNLSSTTPASLPFKPLGAHGKRRGPGPG